MGRGGVLFLDIQYLFSSNYFIFRVLDLDVFFFSWLDRKFTLHIWWQYFFVSNSCLVASSLESDNSLIHFSLYFLFFLVLQTHNLLIIIVVLLFQAGRSDKKASQGHEKKHRGWFRYVTTGCAIDLYLFTNILDAVWQVFQGVKNIWFPGLCCSDFKIRWECAGICLNLKGF